MKRFACAVLLSVAGASFAGVDAYSLKYAPKPGAVTLYAVEAAMEISGSSATMSSKLQQKILKVDSDGTYSVQNDSLDGKVIYGGQELPTPKSSTVTLYRPSGEVISVSGDFTDGSSMRWQNLSMLKRPDAPVNVGDKWVEDIKADAKTGAVAVHGTYTLEAEEKVGSFDTLKVTASLREVEGTDAGSDEITFWLSKEDFSIVKLTSKYTNMTVPGAPGPLSGTTTITRVDK